MRLLLSFLILLTLAGCSGPTEDPNAPKTVASVDLNRYQGKWYEVARLPMIYQRDCLQSEAEYRLQDNQELSVINRCYTDKGQWQEAEGTAWPQVEGQTSRLWVRFHNWVSVIFPWMTRGHYWVLYLDDEYRTAVVGSPDRQFLWFMARTPSISETERAQLLKVAAEQGYDTQSLIWAKASKNTL